MDPSDRPVWHQRGVLTGSIGKCDAMPQPLVVAPRARVPTQLMTHPFTLQEATAAGITRYALRGNAWRRLTTGLYCWSGFDDDPWSVLSGWRRLLPQDAVFVSRSAGWLHGIHVDPIHPIAVAVPSHSGVRSRHGLKVRRTDIPDPELTTIRGVRTTIVRRTLLDLCRELRAVDALAAMDEALRLKLIDKGSVGRLCHLGRFAEPAESPMETRLRWLLISAGLPRPEVQTDLHDSQGRFVGRADLYYPQARLVVEFDGANHRDRLVEDNRRQNRLIDSGFSVLRFVGDDVYNRPDTVAAQVRRALSAGVGFFARRPAAAPR